MARHEIPRKFIVDPIADDELYFVVREERFQVLEIECIRLARMRALHIHNLDDAMRNACQRTLAAGLDQRLLEAGYKVLIETSGERPLARVPHGVIKIVDVKCPHSGEPDTFDLENLEALLPHDEVKFVISDRIDYEFARDFVARHRLAARVNAVLFSPAFRKEATGARDVSHCLLDPQQLAKWMIADNASARLGLQIHKFIWDPAMKGV